MTAPPERGRRLAGAVSPPIVAGRWIAYVTADEDLVVRDHRTGRRRWQADLGPDDEYGTPAPSPALAGEVICAVSRDQTLHAFTLATGALLWEFGHRLALCTPAVSHGTVVVGDENGEIVAIDASDGSVRSVAWLEETAIEAAPAVAGSVAYVPTTTGFVHAVDLASGKVLWPAVTSYQGETSVCVHDDTLLAVSADRVYGIDAHTGERRWRHRLGSTTYAELAIGGDVVLACAGSVVSAIAIADGRLNWETKVKGHLEAASTAGEVVLVASDRPARLHALSLTSGDRLWDVELAGEPIGAPVVLPGRVFITAGGGVEVFTFALPGTGSVPLSARGDRRNRRGGD